MHIPTLARTRCSIAAVRIAVSIALFLICAGSMLAQMPSITIVSGSQMEIDSLVYIEWTQIGIDGPIRIEYSTDSMRTWKLIDSVSKVGTLVFHAWRVPNEPTENGFIRMIYRDSALGRSGRFAITDDPRPEVQIYRPIPSESFFPGDSIAIVWFGQFMRLRPVVIDYSADSGRTWTQIGSRASSRNWFDTLQWVVPDMPTFGARIRVRTVDSVHRFMSGIFVIRQPKMVSVLYPRGGEVFEIDSTVTVHWTTRSIPGGVKLEYSIDGGDFWFTLALRPGNEGPDSVTWIVPPPASDSVYVRVVAEEGTVVDASDGPFSIVEVLTSARDESSSQQQAMRLVAAPNPATSATTLAWRQQQTAAVRLRVYAADGTLVRDASLGVRPRGAQRATFDLDGLAAGSYVVTLRGHGGAASVAIVVGR